MTVSYCSRCVSVFSFCFQGFYYAEETLSLGVQKRKLLGRGSITSPILINQKQLQLPHHSSSLHLFLPPSILPQTQSFLSAGFPNAIALGVAHSTQGTFAILSVLLTFFNAISSFLKEQEANAQKYGVCFSPDRKTWGVDLFSCFLFLDWKPLENLNKQSTCFNCKNLVTNLIKESYTEKMGVLHDVYMQVFEVSSSMTLCIPLYISAYRPSGM